MADEVIILKGAQVREVLRLHPDSGIFVRVQLWTVRWQGDGDEPLVRGEERMHRGTAMLSRVVPDDDDPSPDVS